MNDVLIIGGGPSGLSAALFLARAGLKVTVVDGGRSRLLGVSRIPNYPGLLDEPSGEELLSRLRAHAERYGAQVVRGVVREVRDMGGVFEVYLEDGSRLEAERLLLSTHKDPTVPSLLGLSRKGVYIETDEGGRTSYPRVYAAGVARGRVPGHAIVSAGDGAWVAVQLVSDLRGEPYKDHTG
ncbi:NAD(P)/FAD-dependent oxidoreductase [Thermus filiformis]|uniref:Pyridine nucleotide-disulfide oxidoreductase n=1 Tax=Thermus filiformis TaxID=276 RepID=A0A0A2X7L3_THEFI|nr:NAD(P)/FAD-dependent oxidoreductase [Thermus filiformis]KGQ21174.1 pyridine nucleotide-disulfide oxidoreductase [Thermus filiformis]